MNFRDLIATAAMTIALVGCGFVETEVRGITEIDGINITVFELTNRTDSWGAVAKVGQGQWGRLNDPAQYARNIRAIEVVSGCSAIPATVDNAYGATYIAVDCN